MYKASLIIEPSVLSLEEEIRQLIADGQLKNVIENIGKGFINLSSSVTELVAPIIKDFQGIMDSTFEQMAVVRESLAALVKSINLMLNQAVLSLKLPELEQYWENSIPVLYQEELLFTTPSNDPPILLSNENFSDINIKLIDHRYIAIFLVGLVFWIVIINNPGCITLALYYLKSNWESSNSRFSKVAKFVLNVIIETQIGNIWNKLIRKDAK